MPTSTALLASAFIASLGINTHLDYTVGPYSNTAVAENAINYLGVKNIRDSAWHNGGRNDILVFVTATIVDPAGNRVHSEDDLPFAQKGIPPQPGTK